MILLSKETASVCARAAFLSPAGRDGREAPVRACRTLCGQESVPISPALAKSSQSLDYMILLSKETAFCMCSPLHSSLPPGETDAKRQ